MAEWWDNHVCMPLRPGDDHYLDDPMPVCAARGGVIGLNGFGQPLGDNDDSTETSVRYAALKQY